MVFTKVEYEVNKDLMTMNVELANHTDRNPTVNLNAKLFVDIPDGLYVSHIIFRAREREKNINVRI